MKRFVLSDNSVNSHGFRLDMNRLKLDRFKANPVMLYNHFGLIGKWDNIELKDGVLTAEPVFMDDPDEELAQKTKKRVEKGFLKGASLGIRILEVNRKAGEPPVVTAEVMEASIVDIPANANALALYDESGNKLEGEAYRLALQKLSDNTIKTNIMDQFKLSAKTKALLGITGEPDAESVEKAVEELAAERDQLLNELKQLQNERIETMLNQAIADGRIPAGKKDLFRKQAEENFELFKEMLQALPKAQKLPNPAPATQQLQDDRSDWTFNDWRKKDPAGLLQIKREDPERYKEILNK